MNRLQALEAVAVAARTYVKKRGMHPAWPVLIAAVEALDALPADPAPTRGEVVEAVMWEAKDGYIELSTPGSPASQRSSVWTRLGTTRLPLTGDGA